LIIIFVGSILLTISAKIKIPFYPVPMTMQTFVVLFLGISFGYKIGLATVSLYLFEGIIGLPVFSNSPEKGVGLLYFTGPTMGYLIGWDKPVFELGAMPFLLAEIFKISLLTLLTKVILNLKKLI
jgi:biotin transport system substrate-specific component